MAGIMGINNLMSLINNGQNNNTQSTQQSAPQPNNIGESDIEVVKKKVLGQLAKAAGDKSVEAFNLTGELTPIINQLNTMLPQGQQAAVGPASQQMPNMGNVIVGQTEQAIPEALPEQEISQDAEKQAKDILAQLLNSNQTNTENVSTKIQDTAKAQGPGLLRRILSGFAEGFEAGAAPDLVKKRQKDRELDMLEDKNIMDYQKELLKQSREAMLKPNEILNKYEPVANQFQSIVDSYGRVQASIKNPSAAGDLSLIFNFMKILDPNSVVRESEYATAQNAAAIPERIRALYNSTVNGKKLSEDQRNDFSSRAEELFLSKERQFRQAEEEFKRVSVLNNVNPDNLRKISYVKEGTSKKEVNSKKAPQVGTIKNGYKFMGGSPSDEKNWRKI